MTKITELPDVSTIDGDSLLVIIDGITGEFNKIEIVNFLINLNDVIPSAEVRRTSDFALGSGWVAVTHNSEVYDTDNIWNSENPTRLTCNTPGKYLISGNADFSGSNNGERQIALYLNGTTNISRIRMNGAYNTNEQLTASTVYELGVGDYVELRVYTDTSITVTGTPRLRMTRVA